jgi:hypothetical protein
MTTTMKKITLLAALALSCSAAQALPLDNLMSCSLSPKDFFATLVQAHAIQTPAFKVAPTGINGFKKSSPDSLTFFGMAVGLVVGYADDPRFFQRAPDGTVPAFDGYGFFVQAPVVSVQAMLDSVGYKSTHLQEEPSGLTLVSCQFPKHK